MKYLLDTHIFLWYLLGNSNLSSQAKQIIDTKTNLYFGISSFWEIAIKVNIGKLQLNRPIEDVSLELDDMNIEILPITNQDIYIYSKLPLILNHRDPFDRILVAQAVNNQLILISRDSAFDHYSIQRIW